MDVIYWLIPLSIVILMVAVAIFFWAVRSGQFQDLDSPAIDILFDDDLPEPEKNVVSKGMLNKNSLNEKQKNEDPT